MTKAKVTDGNVASLLTPRGARVRIELSPAAEDDLVARAERLRLKTTAPAPALYIVVDIDATAVRGDAPTPASPPGSVQLRTADRRTVTPVAAVLYFTTLANVGEQPAFQELMRDGQFPSGVQPGEKGRILFLVPHSDDPVGQANVIQTLPRDAQVASVEWREPRLGD